MILNFWHWGYKLINHQLFATKMIFNGFRTIKFFLYTFMTVVFIISLSNFKRL
jgi:hypothetical protein